MLQLPEGTRFQVLAPVIRGRKGEYVELFRSLQSQGFSRARVNGETHPAHREPPKLDKQKKHTIEVVVDRLSAKPSSKRRLTDSVETALSLASGLVIFDLVDADPKDPQRELKFSERMACPNEHDIETDELEPRSFSFNSPFGACPECHGLGTRMEVDPELVVSDPDGDPRRGRDRSRGPGAHVADYFTRLLGALGDELGFDLDTPWAKLSKKAQTVDPRGPPDQGARAAHQPLRPRAVLLHRTSRACGPTSSAGTARPSPTPAGSASRGSCARCPARPAGAAGSSRSRWR